MKVLVCGSRNWTNRDAIWRELEKLPEGTIIVHGGARGADRIAGNVAKLLNFEVRVYPADWLTNGKAAGPIRNQEMLDKEHPDKDGVPVSLGLAFSEDLENPRRGTSDMCRRMDSKGIRVNKFSV